MLSTSKDRFIWMLVSLTAAVIFSLQCPHVSLLPWHPRDRFSTYPSVSSIPCIPETDSIGHTSLISVLAILRQNHLVSPVPLTRRDSLTVPQVSFLPWYPRDRSLGGEGWAHNLVCIPRQPRDHFYLGIPETGSLGGDWWANHLVGSMATQRPFLPWYPRDRFPWWWGVSTQPRMYSMATQRPFLPWHPRDRFPWRWLVSGPPRGFHGSR